MKTEFEQNENEALNKADVSGSGNVEFLPAIKNDKVNCLCCGTTEDHLHLGTILINGFGGWSITKDGKLYYQDETGDWDNCKRLEDIEKDAVLEPNCDWRAVLFSPLRGAEYQRQNDKWVLVEVNEGFA